jgi:hypothetical protein
MIKELRDAVDKLSRELLTARAHVICDTSGTISFDVLAEYERINGVRGHCGLHPIPRSAIAIYMTGGDYGT